MNWSAAFLEVKDVVLFGLAIYAAALSTFNWRQAVRRDRREVLVKFTTAIPTFPDGSLGPAFASLEAVNLGQRPVTIKFLSLELPGGGRMMPIAKSPFPGLADTTLPVTLVGRSHRPNVCQVRGDRRLLSNVGPPKPY